MLFPTIEFAIFFPIVLALSWLLSRKPWIVPIPGTTQMGHMLQNTGAAAIEFTSSELAELNADAFAAERTGNPRALAEALSLAPVVVDARLGADLYEYLIRKFAEGSGQSAGEFFTLWSPDELYAMGPQLDLAKASCRRFQADAAKGKRK